MLQTIGRGTELELRDARRLSLALEDGWTVERRDVRDDFTGFLLRRQDAAEPLTCILTAAYASVKATSEEVQRERLLSHVRGFGAEVTVDELIELPVEHGRGFYAVFATNSPRLIHKTTMAKGVVVHPNGDIVTFALFPFKAASPPVVAALDALAAASFLGERKPTPVREPLDPLMRAITVTLSFHVDTDGRAGRFTILSSDDPAYDDRAIALMRERTFPRNTIGRMFVQPVVFRVEADLENPPLEFDPLELIEDDEAAE